MKGVALQPAAKALGAVADSVTMYPVTPTLSLAAKVVIETVRELEVAGMENPVTVGGMVSEAVGEAKAVAMAAIWAAERLLRKPMPPTLPLMAAWIWAAVLPFFEEVARGPWQLAQFEAYRVAPLGGGVVIDV